MVSGLVTRAILGMDIWVRVGGFTLDLSSMTLHTLLPRTSLPLLPTTSVAASVQLTHSAPGAPQTLTQHCHPHSLASDATQTSRRARKKKRTDPIL